MKQNNIHIVIDFDFHTFKFVSFNFACNKQSHNIVKIITLSNQSSLLSVSTFLPAKCCYFYWNGLELLLYSSEVSWVMYSGIGVEFCLEWRLHGLKLKDLNCCVKNWVLQVTASQGARDQK